MLGIDDINRLEQKNKELEQKCYHLEHENQYMKNLMERENPAAWADTFHIWAYNELKKDRDRLAEKLKDFEKIEYTRICSQDMFVNLVQMSEYPSIEIKSYPFEFGGTRYRGELTTALGTIAASEFVIAKGCNNDAAHDAMEEKILHDIGYHYVKRAYDMRHKYNINSRLHYIYSYKKLYEEFKK